MAKMDKDALKKNQFWIGLGVFCVLWLVAVVMVKTMGDGKAKADYQAAVKSLSDTRNPKNDSFLGPWNEHRDKFKAHKDKIWQQAWDLQQGIYDWPQPMVTAGIVPRYVGDSFTRVRGPDGKGDVTEDLNNRSRYRDDWYKEQFPPATAWDTYVAPVEFLGGFFAVFPMQNWQRSNAPTQEEVWLAQEDYWVRREMLVIVRQALDSVAVFKPVEEKKEEKKEAKKEPEKLPDGIAARHVPRNAAWELTPLLA